MPESETQGPDFFPLYYFAPFSFALLSKYRIGGTLVFREPSATLTTERQYESDTLKKSMCLK